MKRLLKNLNNKQQGVMLVSVILLLGLTGILIAPLLGFMSTGLNAVTVQERNTKIQYAADAGAQDAISRILNASSGVPRTEDASPVSYNLTDINGMDVDVSIDMIDIDTYLVTSVAQNPADGRTITIEATMDILNLSMFTNEAITSPTSIRIQSNSVVNGPIWSSDISGDLSHVTPPPVESPVTGWPTSTEADFIEEFYLRDVDILHPHSNASINLNPSIPVGGLYVYRPGQKTFSVKGNGDLNGTIYVAGDLEIKEDNVIHLCGNTIYVEGSFDIFSGCTIYGPGAIIARGEVKFLPQVPTSDFVYIMSVCDKVSIQPNSNLHGAIAGDGEVKLQPGCHLTWTAAPSSLNLPGINANIITGIKTWIIK